MIRELKCFVLSRTMPQTAFQKVVWLNKKSGYAIYPDLKHQAVLISKCSDAKEHAAQHFLT